MDYALGPVILSSQDKVRMLDFLSDVFEFDVDTETDIITKGNLSLKIVEAQDALAPSSSGVTFAFLLKAPDQIKEIQNKFKFFLYRKAQDPNHERLSFVETQSDRSLRIVDFDGRTWQFDLPARIPHDF